MAGADLERVIFPAQAEGLLRGLHPDVTDALASKLKTLALDPGQPFPPAWPSSRLKEWLDAISDVIYESSTRDEAHRRIGRRFIDGWQRTMLGAASAQLLKVLGTRRALERLTRAFRTGDNYTESSVTFPAPTVALVTVRSEPLPHYIAGVLDGGLSLLNLKGRVSVESVTGDVMVFRIEWEG
ncbi:MAG: DUF2378 family protein [Archangium sp.]|nr:DUF2378 family protein [Archangium sp.]